MTISKGATRFLSFKLLLLTPLQRRLLLIAADALLLPFSVLLSHWLLLDDPLHPSLLAACWWLLPAIWVIGLPLYALSGQYKGLTRYAGSRSIYLLTLRNGMLVLMIFLFGWLFGFPLPPFSVWFLLWFLLTGFTGSVRFVLRDALISLQNNPRKALIRVAIYGAGVAGVQLAAALRLAKSHSVEFFVDDDPVLARRSINGVPIEHPETLQHRVDEIDQVLLAIPSLSRSRRRQIVDALQQSGMSVLQIPSMDEITSGRARIDSLRPIEVEELLGRDPVTPNTLLLGPGITGLSVCVTGAGGSIGSELCRQIFTLKPKRLVLFEQSEPSLYVIHQELSALLPSDVEVIPVLGNASNGALVDRCFNEQSVDIVFHAAAYKHVPLVESNPLAGLANNVLSTRVVCDSARRFGLRQLVLISTDKAVRPTNVMGASKRLAELVVQAQPQGPTCFSMVRFGNVLGSSGSVVPLFKQQIAAGGPITLTHPEIIRYFMTIPEASQLVLQAAVLAKGGDVLLLDMGEPVRIKSLAEQMIRLSGLSLKNDENPNGDIEIVYTGLRPGEKLFEELLIDAIAESTSHPLIFRAQERFLESSLLCSKLDLLEKAIDQQDLQVALSILNELVPEWQPQDTSSFP